MWGAGTHVYPVITPLRKHIKRAAIVGIIDRSRSLSRFSGQVLDEKRRVVVRRDTVGNPAPGQVEAVRGVRRPPGGGKPVAHARGRRPVRVSTPAGVQPGHLRPDARVLETTGVGETDVP